MKAWINYFCTSPFYTIHEKKTDAMEQARVYNDDPLGDFKRGPIQVRITEIKPKRRAAGRGKK